MASDWIALPRNGFIEAVDELEAYGETPILAALDLALNEKVGSKPQLLVLLTDGFEFTKVIGNTTPRPFDEPRRYDKVRKQLKESSTELVIFNMMSVDVISEQVSDLTKAQNS